MKQSHATQFNCEIACGQTVENEINRDGATALIATNAFACSYTNNLCASVYALDGTIIVSALLCTVMTNAAQFSLLDSHPDWLESQEPDPLREPPHERYHEGDPTTGDPTQYDTDIAGFQNDIYNWFH